MKSTSVLRRLPVLMVVLLILLAGLWAGLVRIGWALPPLGSNWVANHGPLMISGFLGTLISLERAVALAARLKARWPYVAPAATGLGGLALLAGLPDAPGRALITAGSLALAILFVAILRRSLNAAYVTMALGAGLWLVGNGLWALNEPVFRAASWRVGFLVLTIAGERLELARVLLLRRSAFVAFVACIGLFLAGLVLSLIVFQAGLRLAGAGLAALGLWLLRYDLARVTIRQSGLTRYIAACLLPGYTWLGCAGVFWIGWADRFQAGPLYDAMLHSLLLGYVFSMVFGHAPIILPALTNGEAAYRPQFYLHLGLLHAGLLLRVIGDVTFDSSLRLWGGLLNALAILLFIGNTVLAQRDSARSARRSKA